MNGTGTCIQWDSLTSMELDSLVLNQAQIYWRMKLYGMGTTCVWNDIQMYGKNPLLFSFHWKTSSCTNGIKMNGIKSGLVFNEIKLICMELDSIV